MKKTELIFNLISIPVDALSLLVAGVVSFYLRQESTHIVGPIIYQLNFHQFLKCRQRFFTFQRFGSFCHTINQRFFRKNTTNS